MGKVPNAESATAYQVGGWLFQPRLHLLSQRNQSRRLEPRQSAMLACLLERPGDVFSKDELIERLWPGSIATDQALAKTVSRLRGTLQTEGVQIEAVSKSGYRLVGTVEKLTLSTAELADASARGSAFRRFRQRPTWVIVATSAVTAFVIGWVVAISAMLINYD